MSEPLLLWHKVFIFMALVGGPLICIAAMLAIRFYQTRIKPHDH